MPTIIAHKLSKIVAFVKSQNLIELTPESSVSSGAEPGKLTGFCQGLPSLAGLVTIMSLLGYQPDFTSHYAAEKSMLEYSLADCLQDPNRQESCQFMISFSLNGVKQELSLASLYNSESDRLVFSRYI